MLLLLLLLLLNMAQILLAPMFFILASSPSSSSCALLSLPTSSTRTWDRAISLGPILELRSEGLKQLVEITKDSHIDGLYHKSPSKDSHKDSHIDQSQDKSHRPVTR